VDCVEEDLTEQEFQLDTTSQLADDEYHSRRSDKTDKVVVA